ncbi:exosortase F system-associated membrane protein [Apibacter raozihei]|uniref:exosortase F system-associated membrane protein n=1 Tax=Apibacter raozihei TaxID=2500547 RepID=UPI000FE3C628
MKNKIRILGIIFCFILLITIRRLEVVLFYDPLLAFYKQTKFNHLPVPDFNIIKLILSLIFRYTLNTFLSLLILKLWFNNKNILKLSLYIYIIGFIIFTILYIGSLYTNFGLGYMPTFYIRRILIQPVILLILIPSVYYYKYTKNKSTN